MYPASVKFHEAAQSESPKTRVLLRFGDTLLTNEDINLESGDVVKLVEDLIPREEKELTIGITPSSELTATINNDHRLLDNFSFGPCTAQLAAMTESGGIAYSIANCMTVMRFGANQELRFEGWSSRPYLTINGYAPTAQPPWAVYSILTVGNGVYCFAPDGEAWKATWVDGRIWSMLTGQTWNETAASRWDDIQGVLVPATALESWKTLEPKKWDEMKVFTWNSFIDLPDLNPFMRRKAARWAADRRGMSWNADVLHEFWADGSYEKYEYVKLGVFNVDTPKKRKVQLISIVGHDRMRKFDVDATAFWNSLTWPISLGSIFTKLCQFVGVPQATISFINSTRMYAEKPTELEQVSAREILGWIAEAACSIARMTRDGGVELAWFTPQPVTFDDSHWFSADIAEYSVSRIDKLQVKSAQNDIGVIVGDTGKNAYVTLDNPFLYGADDYDIRVAAVPIYNRLTAFPDFSPISTRVRTNWALQAGDIVSFDLDGQIYQLPIYSQSITWNGKSARAEIQNTGEPSRPAVNAQNRRVFAQKRAMHEIEVTVDGLSHKITGVEGNIAELTLRANQFQTAIYDADGNSRITQNADKISLVVDSENAIKAASIVASINQTTGESLVKIDANHVNINGVVTANNYFKINTDGSFEAKTGKIGGWTVDEYRIYNGNNADTATVILNSRDGSVTAKKGYIGGFELIGGANWYGGVTTGLAGNGLSVSSEGYIYYGPPSSPYAMMYRATSGDVGAWVFNGPASNDIIMGARGFYFRNTVDTFATGQVTTTGEYVTASLVPMWCYDGLSVSGHIFNNPYAGSLAGSECRWQPMSDGSYYLFRVTSTRSTKKDFEPVGDECVAIIDKLDPHYFRDKDQDSNTIRNIGFFADNVASVCPELGVYSLDGEPISVQYSNFTSLLTADAQITHRRMNDMERRLVALEGRVA